MCWFHPLHIFIHSFLYSHNPCCFLLGYAFGFQIFTTGGSFKLLWLPLVLLSTLWVSYYDLIFVCLTQSLKYMLWMTTFKTFSLKDESGFPYVIKSSLIHDVQIVYVVEAFITLTRNAKGKYTGPILACHQYVYICFFSINFSYIRDLISQ